MTIAGDSGYPDFAIFWSSYLCGNTHSLKKLSGGINNLVYSCGLLDKSWIIKGYKKPVDNGRDHMKAEIEFLNYSNIVASEFTPRLYHVDPFRHCVVLEFIKGSSFLSHVPITNKSLHDANKFLYLLNHDVNLARKSLSQPAADGFLKLTEHLQNVSQRLNEMDFEHLPSAIKDESIKIFKILTTEFSDIENSLMSSIDSSEINNSISPQVLCISPSDFGFHNAIQTPSMVKFFDFEFAGWDDPAKTLLDFILQPRLPIKLNTSPLFSSLQPFQTLDLNNRCTILAPLMRFKWYCIILAFMRPIRHYQMLSVLPESDYFSMIQDRLSSFYLYKERTASIYC